MESSRKVPWRAHQCPVIEIPGIQCKTRYLSFDKLNKGVESQSKAQWAQRIALLHPAAAVDGVLTQEE